MNLSTFYRKSSVINALKVKKTTPKNLIKPMFDQKIIRKCFFPKFHYRPRL